MSSPAEDGVVDPWDRLCCSYLGYLADLDDDVAGANPAAALSFASG
jgi:hypothetical protein